MASWPMLAESIQNPEDFPNLLTGSFTDGRKFSTGNTLPIVARPWGFNHWCPQTTNGATSWWFGGSDHEFHWIRLTHQPSPWIGDWAFVMLGPQMGGRVEEPTMFFEPWGARIKPYTFDATLGPDNMRVQLTPTDHCAVLKVTFPSINPQHHEKRVCLKLPAPNKKPAGYSQSSLGDFDTGNMWTELTAARADDAPRNFGLYVRAEVDVASLRDPSSSGRGRHSRSGNMHCFEFSTEETEVTVYIGASLISKEQAQLNMQREVRGRRFEEVEEESRMVWRSMLSRIDVVDPGAMTQETFRRLSIFYTGLYRALLFPRRLDELDSNGRRHHYSPYDSAGQMHDGILVTDTGFWDTFRTVYPLLSLAYPEEAAEIVTGWLNAFREGGWLPEWSSPGYRSCMVGTYADVVVADAVLKGLSGVDLQLAWEAMRKDSFVPGGGKGQGGKARYNDYDRNGFIPKGKDADSVSATLDFAFSDFAVSCAAEKLGKHGDAKRLRNRATRAREHLFDRNSGLMLPKLQTGRLETGEPSRWGSGYVEGSAWHHSFPAYDLPGLASLHGSRTKLASKIVDMMEVPGTFLPGSYRVTIHEMEEMRALGMGQYGHNNQPVHHILWLLLMLDDGSPQCNATVALPDPHAFCPRRLGEAAISTVMRKAYGFDFYSGDEDNGEMGAWYVLAALGLFEAAPGTDQGYVLGSPLFRRVDVYRKAREGGTESPSLSIQSLQAGTEDVLHVSRVLMNGRDVGSPSTSETALGWTISYGELVRAMPGAVLRFITGNEDAGGKTSSLAVPNFTQDGSDRLQAQRRIRELESMVQDQQRQLQLQRSLAKQQASALQKQQSGAPRADESPPAATPPAAVAPWQPGPAGSNSNAEVQQAYNHIHDLENQVAVLKHQSRTESEMNSGLATTVEMAFIILVAVNALGWILCICNHRRSQASGSTAGGSRRLRRSTTNGRRGKDMPV